ncbi:MAG: DUF4406 domain-containing protein, partial [Prevotella sp.]
MKKKQKIYLSGPIGDNPDMNEVTARFGAYQAYFEKQGFEVVNPLNNGLKADASRIAHMKADIRLLLDCDVIHLQPGWKSSDGCWCEKIVASQCGIVASFAKII